MDYLSMFMDQLTTFFDRFPALPIGCIVVLLLLGLLRLKQKTGVLKDLKAQIQAGLLGQVLFWFDNSDAFSVRDLLNGGVVIMGRAGSGKTSSSGKLLGKSIVNNHKSGGLILAAKPEDADMWIDIFRKAGREDDLIIFDADGSYRFNFLNYLGAGPVRNTVQLLTTIGETIKRGKGKGKDDSAFWDSLNERFLYNAVAALKAAGEPISGERILKFIHTAPTSAEELRSEQWQQLYHFKALERADSRPHGKIEAHDHQLCKEFWAKEFPFMDPKTRSNGLAGVMNILHPFNTGIVRDMCSGETNCSPDDILNGKWVLVNFAPSVWHEVGSFISAGWKYLTQLAILKRKATEDSPFCTIWADEAHLFTNEFDSTYIAQCRSHRGCLVYLTQSVSSFYATMQGEAGKHQADALLANFSHAIIHASDPVTSKWAAAKLGRRKEILFSGSSSNGPHDTIWDQLNGNTNHSTSYSEHYEQTTQDQEMMVGRTGGPENGFIADAVVLKSGEPFADGSSFKKVAFSQR